MAENTAKVVQSWVGRGLTAWFLSFPWKRDTNLVIRKVKLWPQWNSAVLTGTAPKGRMDKCCSPQLCTLKPSTRKGDLGRGEGVGGSANRGKRERGDSEVCDSPSRNLHSQDHLEKSI